MKRGLFLTSARCVALTIFAVAASSSAYARTLTWDGTSASSYETAASLNSSNHWLENGVAVSDGPQPGDRIEITGSGNFYFAKEQFDLGSAGLTIYHTRKIYVGTSFTGTGVLTFDGGNVVRQFDLTEASSHSGGTVIKSGQSYINAAPNPFGTGSVTIYQQSADRPNLQSSSRRHELDNDFILKGKADVEEWAVFKSESQGLRVRSITSDHDFSILQMNRAFVSNGAISAPGKTVTIEVASNVSGNNEKETVIAGAIDASVDIKAYEGTSGSWSIVRFSGESTVVTNSLTVNSGTNRFDAAASWAGTNVTVRAGGMLELQGAGNLSSNACLTVEDGGIVKIASGVTNWISQLVVAGESLDVDRYYTSADLPDAIEGDGALHVQPTTHYVWTGGTSQFWSEPSNWDRNEVPGDGAVAVFNAAANVNVTNATAVSIGAAGLTLVANGGTVNFRTPLEGAGRLTVTGSSTVHLFGECTYTGGTRVEESVRLCPRFAASPLGTGDVFIDGTAGQPCILALTYNTTFPNNFIVSGVITNNPYTDSDRTSYGAIQAGQTTTFNGSITCDDDLLITDRNGILTVNGDISVPADKTVRLCNLTSDSNKNKVVAVNGLVSGNLSVEGIWPVRLNANAVCTGTNVMATGSAAVLRLLASANLNEACALTLLDGAKLDIESGVQQRVAAFTVGSAVKPEGSYNSSNCSDGILGTGVLRVGPHRGFIISLR